MTMPTLVLAPGRERSLLRRHPWIFSGAVRRLEGSPGSGETVEVHAHDGTFLARAAYSPRSQIRARVWSFDAEEAIDEGFFHRRIERAVAARRPVAADEEPAGRRLVYSESDFLPGLVVDHYGEHLVCQFLSAGAERWKGEIVAALGELLAPAGISERSDTGGRKKEGLAPAVGLLAGEEPPERIEIREGELRYLVDVRGGHKTGFYLDQRENRARLAAEVAAAVAERGPGGDPYRVLNVFAYTGGFGIAAQAAGAGAVTHLESSAPLLPMVADTVARNDLDPSRVELAEGNAFSLLRAFRAEERRFDCVILDPPKFVDARSRLEAAARGYKDVNLLACQLLAPGGLLATFSCSSLVDPALFQKIVAGAALDAGRDAQILARFDQAPDHPTALAFPEGSYLKGLLCRVE